MQQHLCPIVSNFVAKPVLVESWYYTVLLCSFLYALRVVLCLYGARRPSDCLYVRLSVCLSSVSNVLSAH